MSVTTTSPSRPAVVTGATFSVLVALSFCHTLNDMARSLFQLGVVLAGGAAYLEDGH